MKKALNELEIGELSGANSLLCSNDRKIHDEKSCTNTSASLDGRCRDSL